MHARIKPSKGRTIEFGPNKTLLEYKEGESYPVAKTENSIVWLIHPDNTAASQSFVIVEDVILEGEEK